MKVIGLSGGPNRTHEEQRDVPHFDGYWHDAAAALVVDGVVVSAHEEERHTRVKHTNKFPARAIRACLADTGVGLGEVDAVAVYFDEPYWRREITIFRQHDPHYGVLSARARLAELVTEACGEPIDQHKFQFVDHHRCHARSTLEQSGLDEALVLTIDGAGDNEAGRLLDVHGDDMRTLWTLPTKDSLGGLYLLITRHLGYGQFEEYKVMGLAPYGEADSYVDRLNMVQLHSDGVFAVNWDFYQLLQDLCPARRRDEPIRQVHLDLAATVQVTLERAVLHLLGHFQRTTKHRNLCLAGGVAHNATMNGRILASGRFDNIFVHPASQDSGCAVGAALAVRSWPKRTPRAARKITHVYWGTDIPYTGGATDAAIERWQDFLDVTPLDGKRRADVLARALVDGEVVGVAEGRAEFGPRALGNRSILADPRPSENRDRINSMIKKRESFRPFAPVVAVEDAHEFFELPGDTADCSFMSFAVPVRPEWRTTLGAVTHIDGTARLQTVGPEQNPRLWRLLRRFAELSGVPILLNTSFNTSAEPIVDTADDAIVCLLTSGLPRLALGDYLVSAKPAPPYEQLCLRLPIDVTVSYRAPVAASAAPEHVVEREGPVRTVHPISAACFGLLQRADPDKTLADLLKQLADDNLRAGLLGEILALWERRFVVLSPGGGLAW